MKKVLLASTALVATSSFALAADVKVSGNAEIGIFDNGVDDVQFFQSADVRFSMTGETDAGLSFGATIDLDDLADMGILGHDSNDVNGGQFADFTVFVSGSFGNLTMGDTDGAFDWALSEVGALTSIADDHTTHIGYSGNSGLDGTYDGQVLRYDNTFNDFGFALSAELDDTGTGDEVIGVGVRWSGDMGGTDIAVGLGYQDNGVTDVTGVSLRAGFGDLTAVLNYSTFSATAGDTDHVGVGVTYSSGPLSLHANWGEFDPDVGLSTDGYGVAANYDLGGGAVAMLGYGSENAAGEAQWSAGLGLSF